VRFEVLTVVFMKIQVFCDVSLDEWLLEFLLGLMTNVDEGVRFLRNVWNRETRCHVSEDLNPQKCFEFSVRCELDF
jgi:hypothetical protein